VRGIGTLIEVFMLTMLHLVVVAGKMGQRGGRWLGRPGLLRLEVINVYLFAPCTAVITIVLLNENPKRSTAPLCVLIAWFSQLVNK
jgi:hypothetical protein